MNGLWLFVIEKFVIVEFVIKLFVSINVIMLPFWVVSGKL